MQKELVKIRLVRFHATLFYQVLEQPKFILKLERDIVSYRFLHFKPTVNIYITRQGYPEIYEKYLYLRGIEQNKDLKGVCYTYESVEEASEIERQMNIAIKEFNEWLNINFQEEIKNEYGI